MSHTGVPELPQHSSAIGPAPSAATAARSYASVLAALVRDPRTSYRLRQLIQDDQVLRQSGVLADDVLLERLDALVSEDAAIEGPREIPPGPVLHTEALRRGGYEPTRERLGVQAHVVSGELSADEAVQAIIAAAKSVGQSPS